MAYYPQIAQRQLANERVALYAKHTDRQRLAALYHSVWSVVGAASGEHLRSSVLQSGLAFYSKPEYTGGSSDMYFYIIMDNRRSATTLAEQLYALGFDLAGGDHSLPND